MKQSPWVSETEASKKLGVSRQTLEYWREIGYLKPGTHWRSSTSMKNKLWEPSFIYHLRWCKEILDYWKSHDVPISNIAA